MIPYFRHEVLEPSVWPKHMTSCYSTYTVVGVNIKREMVLSLNNEDVANSSKNILNSRLVCTNHTLFQTQMVEIDTLFQTKTAKKTNTLARLLTYGWFSHDVTKIQTKKLSIPPRFYFHDALEQLKTNFHTNFRFKSVLGFVIECVWISKLLRDAAFTWRPRELSCRLKKWLISGINSSCIRKSITFN